MGKPLKLLIVEDNPDDAEMALVELRTAGFEPDWQRVDTEAAYLERLNDGLDLVLSDYQMPTFNGIRALELLMKRGIDVPFILVSGTVGEETAVAAVRMGATDYLMKDRLGRMGAAVTHALEERRLRGERRQAEGALAELSKKTALRERLLSTALSSMSDFAQIYDRDGRLLFANQPLLDLWGRTMEEITGRNFHDLEYPHDLAVKLQAQLRRVFETKRAVKDESAYTSPTGIEGYYEYIFAPVFAPDGTVDLVVGSTRDVTARKRSEESLRAIAASLAASQRIAHLGSWEMDLENTEDTSGNALRWSDEMFRIAGLGPGSVPVTNELFFRLVPPEDREPIHRAVAAAIRDRGIYSIVHRLVRADGEVRILEETAQVFLDEKTGLPSKIVGTAHDITTSRLAEEALRLSEKRFRALFEQAAVGVVQADAVTGRLVRVNQRFCEITGRSREELEQATFASITHPQDVGPDMETVRRIREGSIRKATGEKRYLRKDGAVVWVNLTISAMWAPGEPPDFLIAVAQDVTERKQLEEQFRQAQKMEAIGTLAGGIAHDFNNILAAINGYTELSQMVLEGNPKVRDYLGSVLQASTRATDLVRQILAFSRQQPSERRPIQLRPVVEETLKLLRATLPSTIEFDVTFGPGVPTVLADATQIHQILMNLGTNAWHAMKDRPGRLRVKLEKWTVDAAHASDQPLLRPGAYARLSVGDTGCGMDPATVRRIFDPFFTTKPLGEGTGLGLAVVHGIMDSHDGVVTVHSQPGDGAVFHLYFPAHACEAMAAAAAEGSIPFGHGERILFVDDEELLARLGQKILGSLGYDVEVAMQPAAALAMVRSDPGHFALVVTDQTMPGMTGLVLAAQIRQIRADLPILLATGYSLSLTPERIEEAGIRQLLIKPMTVRSLGTAVHAALNPRAGP